MFARLFGVYAAQPRLLDHRAVSPASVDEGDHAYSIRRAACRNCDAVFFPEFSLGGDAHCTVDCRTMDTVYGRYIRGRTSRDLSEVARQVAEDAKRTKREVEEAARRRALLEGKATEQVDPSAAPKPTATASGTVATARKTTTTTTTAAPVVIAVAGACQCQPVAKAAAHRPRSSDTATMSVESSPGASNRTQPWDQTGAVDGLYGGGFDAGPRLKVATSPIHADAASRRPGGLTLLFQSLEA